MEWPNCPFSPLLSWSSEKYELQKITRQQFKSTFGVSLEICYKIWKVCNWEKMVKNKHLLWALIFLQTYVTEHILAANAGNDEKTYWKYVLSVLESIAWAHRKVVSAHYFISCISKYDVSPSHMLLLCIMHYRLILKIGIVIAMVKLA